MIKHSIILCDKQWHIEKLIHKASDSPFEQGARLTDYLSDPDTLLLNDTPGTQNQCFLTLQFRHREEPMPALISNLPHHYLVFLAYVQDARDFADYAKICSEHISWAEQHLTEPFQDEYTRIQQLNNQLVNSQRALMKSNHQMKQLLEEVREAHSTIALLERDHLTNLFSAPAFYRKVEKRIAKNPEEPFDIIVLTMEHFILINEIFGRKAGDRLLQNLALFLNGLPNAEQGIIARAYADTFYIYMPSQYRFYEKLSSEMEHFFHHYPLSLHVCEQIGVFSSTSESTSIPVEQMCDRAKLALKSGSHPEEQKVFFYTPDLYEKLILDHRILDYVDTALKERQFRLFLQPKVDMRTGEIIGAEALIRWTHPELGFIPPDRFIPLLEKEGNIYPVDRYIWEKACRILHENRLLGLPPFSISVNVARGDLYQTDLLDVLLDLLKRYDLEPKDLHLEILERSYVHDSENMLRIISNLREHGFYIEMDDFGTGESSLAMVSEMPVDMVKVDRHFLTVDLKDKHHTDVLRFIIALAKSLDISILAEGVETQEQADLLTSMGCYLAQGYFYGKPQPAEEFLESRKNQFAKMAGVDESPVHITDAIPDRNAFWGKRILLAEDNELSREIATALLTEAGFIVDTAADGAVAVEKLKASLPGQYDFVLMDIQMPYMSGYEATRQIRSLPDDRLAHIPIIALTAKSFVDDQNKAREAGMDAHISKPIDVDKLLNTLQELYR